MKRRIDRLSVLALYVLAACGIVLSPAQARPLATGLGKDFASETVTVTGTVLHYVRGGKGPPLILIHGFPQDWFEYQAIMPRLAKRFTVIAVDLRGTGGSKATKGGLRCEGRLVSCGQEQRHVIRPALRCIELHVGGKRPEYLKRGVELRRTTVGLQIVSLFAGREFTEVEKVAEVVRLTAGDQFLS